MMTFIRKYTAVRTECLRKIRRARRFSGLCVITCAVFVCSCAVMRKDPLVIWTDRAEFAPYIELFNASQDKVKTIAVYKRSPAQLFPPPKAAPAPDIIIAPGLKNQKARSRFLPLNRLFSAGKIDKDDFYANLLTHGIINGKICFLPVSFNLTAVIFDSERENESLIPHEYLISLSQMREAAERFNGQKERQTASMGFGTSWEKSFLYLAAKLYGARFRSGLNGIEWDTEALQDAVQFLRGWTLSANISTAAEEDFAFKYLYMPPERQVLSGICLFACAPSGSLFMIPEDIQENISFRWLHKNFQIPADDECVYFAINKESKNIPAAEFFADWFFREETQRALMERSNAMRLNTAAFGIAGGFSSLKQVTERVFPAYYPQLLGNIPPVEYITAPEMLPQRWDDIRQEVIIPYLSAVCDTRNDPAVVRPLAEGFTE
ncbi:MAG: extracellular solute-binding protein [Treponemataceae bacterium]|nr:MAG: extracellular solute-binding protein [Treponemataceae bacterium]